MKYRVLLLLSVLVSGCSTAPRIPPDQLVSTDPYYEKFKKECVRLRAPEESSGQLSDAHIENLCESRANRFIKVSTSYLSYSLDSDAVEVCENKEPSMQTECWRNLQTGYYEGSLNALLEDMRNRR